MASVEISLSKFDVNSIVNKLEAIPDETTKLAISNTLAKKCDPYVPFANGDLSQTAEVTSEGVRYTQPYARYQYYGEVYGPNIPIIKDGIIVGWFSPPNQKKHPTGRPINYNKEAHPLATSKWDEAMLRDHREDFEKEVTEIIAWRLKQLNG
jgi:hypothetical protein